MVKAHCHLRARILLAVLCFAFSPFAQADQKIRIKASPEIDERLFLVRLLEEMYDQWPAELEDRGNLSKQLASFRLRALHYCEYVKAGQFDQEVARAYSDLLSAIDAYEEFLIKIDRIDRDSMMSARSQERGVAESLVVGVLSKANPVMGILKLLGEQGTSERRNESRRREIEDAKRAFEHTITSTLVRAETVVSALATKRGWNRDEAGFDLPIEEKQRVIRLRASAARPAKSPVGNDAEALLHADDLLIQKRPKDPFVIERLCLDRALTGRASVHEAVAGIVAAASLIPEVSAYDECRARFLLAASELAYVVAFQRDGQKGFGLAQRAVAANAAELLEASLHYGPSDPTGQRRDRWAAMLALSGQHREALTAFAAIQDLRKLDPGYSYNYACLLSVLGRTDDAWRWFEHAVRNAGFKAISYARQDPDLENLRRAKPQEFIDLTSVRSEWWSQTGLLSGDIFVKNNCAFTLTNVKLSVQLSTYAPVRGGGKTLVRQYSLPDIAPGKTGKWHGQLPAGHWNEAKGTLTCDQAP